MNHQDGCSSSRAQDMEDARRRRKTRALEISSNRIWCVFCPTMDWMSIFYGMSVSRMKGTMEDILDGGIRVSGFGEHKPLAQRCSVLNEYTSRMLYKYT